MEELNQTCGIVCGLCAAFVVYLTWRMCRSIAALEITFEEDRDGPEEDYYEEIKR
jgi:hypothetical protein